MSTQKPLKIAAIASHPVQYQVPWFRELAKQPEFELLVYYVFLPNAEQQGLGFGQAFSWDIPLLEGYSWKKLENTAAEPNLGNFRGCRISGFDKILREDNRELLIVTGWNSLALLQGAWAAKRLGLPVLVRGDSNALRRRSLRIRLVHRLMLKVYDYYLYVGKANYAFYTQNGVKPERLHACPHFIENERFQGAVREFSAQRKQLRARWNIPEDSTCFLFCGKFIEKKRPLDVLHALAEARRRMPGIHLLMVGSGELLETTRHFVEEHKLPVSFSGFLNQSEIGAAYVAADCLVLPSDYGETWGLVVNEAMACGIPAIVSDRVGCGPDLIQEGESGFLFPFGDVGALAECMGKAAGNREQLKNMGRRAREKVCAEYSVSEAVKGTMRAVRAALPKAL